MFYRHDLIVENKKELSSIEVWHGPSVIHKNSDTPLPDTQVTRTRSIKNDSQPFVNPHCFDLVKKHNWIQL